MLIILLVSVGQWASLVSGQCSLITNGGWIAQSVTINSYEGPCLIQNDLIIAQKYTLTLNPGTELRFSPGVMLAINGTLIAQV